VRVAIIKQHLTTYEEGENVQYGSRNRSTNRKQARS